MTQSSSELSLSRDRSIPAYQRLKDAIKLKVASGEWQPGQLIPSENKLSEDLGISRMTINRPLRELASEGVLRRVHGLGTFVAEPPRRAHLIELVSIAEEIAQQGKQHSARVLSLESVAADAALSERMQLPLKSSLYRIVIVHFQDEVPIQLEFRHVSASLVPNFINVDFTNTTTTEYLISQIRPEELEHVVQAIVPTEFIARHLDIPLNEPCLKLSRRTWINDEVVTAAELIYPSSRYELGDRYRPASAA